MNIASGLGSATTLTADDAAALDAIAGIEAIASGVRTRTWVDASHRRVFAPVRGVEAPLATIHAWRVDEGRVLSGGGAVDEAVVGRIASDELFGIGFDPVGETLRIGGRAFRVVGLIDASDADQNETVFVPLSAMQAILGIRHLHTIEVSVEQAGEATRVAEDITRVLRERHARGRQGTSTAGLGGNQMPGAEAAPARPTISPSRLRRRRT